MSGLTRARDAFLRRFFDGLGTVFDVLDGRYRRRGFDECGQPEVTYRLLGIEVDTVASVLDTLTMAEDFLVANDRADDIKWEVAGLALPSKLTERVRAARVALATAFYGEENATA